MRKGREGRWGGGGERRDKKTVGEKDRQVVEAHTNMLHALVDNPTLPPHQGVDGGLEASATITE